jgi:uncharacterized protein
MTHLLAVVLLAVAFLAGLALVPLGLPGLWVMVLAFLTYAWVTGFASVTLTLVVAVVGLAVLGEIVEAWVGFKFAKRYGGSNRAGWGALLGGLVGAAVGVPVPVLGSVIGGFIGAFVGAALFEYTNARRTGVALRAGWGAVLGRAGAAAAKMALGVVIAVLGLYAAIRGL